MNSLAKLAVLTMC